MHGEHVCVVILMAIIFSIRFVCLMYRLKFWPDCYDRRKEYYYEYLYKEFVNTKYAQLLLLFFYFSKQTLNQI